MNRSNIEAFIATADSFLAYNLAPLYRNLVFGDAKFNLEIKLHPADMIYALVSKKEVDLGFVTYKLNYPYVTAEKKPLVRANSISVLYNFLSANSSDFWMFAPKTTVLGLMRDYHLRILNLDGQPPKRTCYKLTHTAPTETTQRNIDKFNSLLSDYLTGM